MADIELDASVKTEVVAKLQKYFENELQQEIGGFDAEFLLDFFSKDVGGYYYALKDQSLATRSGSRIKN